MRYVAALIMLVAVAHCYPASKDQDIVPDSDSDEANGPPPPPKPVKPEVPENTGAPAPEKPDLLKPPPPPPTEGENGGVKPEVEKVKPPPPPPGAENAIEADGKMSETTRKKLLAEINKYRMMHDATPVGYCPACVDTAQEWVNKIAASGDIKSDHSSKYGQTVFSTKDPEATSQGPDYFGTLIAATWYNQIKNYDFVKNEFKGNADDFSQLVWEGSEVVGFASAKGADNTIYVIAYYNPAGNNETMNFYENVNRVTGSGDIEVGGKTKCPEGWTAQGTNCYKLFNSEMTWSDAVDHCNVLKSSLVSAESPEEGMYIRSLLAEKEKGAWLGMSDTAMKGGFQFVDGTPYVYSDWSYDSYTWLYAHPTDARSKCITASKDGWSYKDCATKLPFTCKMRPNGVLSFSVDLYFPGSTFTNDLAQIGAQRYTTLKDQIDKAFNTSYGQDIWFVGSTFYQFMPRDNGEIAASTLLKFAPDVRAPVDPISKLREYLRGQNDVKILAVRLIPGVGRVSTPVMTAGTCPSGCSGDCYPECNPGCCGAAVSLSAPAIPSGYTACPAFQGCAQSCQPQCSASCCSANQAAAAPVAMQQTAQIIGPVIQMLPAAQAAPAAGCAASCAPSFTPQCCGQAAAAPMPMAPSTGCAPSCAPSFSPSCCAQQAAAIPQMAPMPAAAPAGCSAQCAPSFAPSCCQQQAAAAMPQQMPQMAAARPGCSPQCAPSFSQSCCQQMQQMQAAPQMMAAPMPQAANACSAMAPGCSAACAPACRSSCCGARNYRNVIGGKRSKTGKKLKKAHKKKAGKKEKKHE